MNYWLNIHHPRERTGESFQDQCRVYVQKKTDHYKDKIEHGDMAFIYETARPNRRIMKGNARGVREVFLRRGAKGIIAMVKISSDFKHGDWLWDGDEYVGYFETEIIEAKVVTLNSINTEFIRSGIQSRFVPLVYGGIKPINDTKASTIKRLIKQYV